MSTSNQTNHKDFSKFTSSGCEPFTSQLQKVLHLCLTSAVNLRQEPPGDFENV